MKDVRANNRKKYKKSVFKHKKKATARDIADIGIARLEIHFSPFTIYITFMKIGILDT